MYEPAPEEIVWNLLRGALGTQALAIACRLGLPDALSKGPRPVAELASEAEVDEESLYRLLRALASDGVFEEKPHGVFRQTPASELLGRGRGWSDFARLFGGVWYRTVGDFGVSGEPTFPQTFGTDFWSWLAAHPEDRAAFDRAMQEGTVRRADRLAPLDWRGDETVVDVGGGNGSLLVELLRKRTGLRGIVFDRPETVRDEAALGDRIEFVEGDFFESVPRGDVYVLSGILHDWDDERATAILRTVRAAAGDDGRLLIIDSVLPDGNDPDGAKWLDLLMLALLGGKERSEAQWRALLEAGGFDSVRFHEAVIEASPA